MLIRRDKRGVFLISQPSHAWLAGQLARAWGNADFPPPFPLEDFCFAAEQHDNGWLGWEERPAFDSRSGLPKEFWDVAATEHTALWRAGVRRMQTYGRFPALLVSLHANTIYEQTFDPENASAENADAVRTFLSEQHIVQSALTGSLRADPTTTPFAADAIINRCKTLLLIVDQISLHLCWGIKDRVTVTNAPGRDGACELHLSYNTQSQCVSIDPWPFNTEVLRFRIEGKAAEPRYDSEEAMQKALLATELTSLECTLKA